MLSQAVQAWTLRELGPQAQVLALEDETRSGCVK